MAAPKRAPQSEGLAPQGELAELLHLEARLADRVTALDLETERIRAGAMAGRVVAEAEFAAQLDAELRALEARLELAHQARVESIAQVAEAAARRIRAIDNASVDALAEHVAVRVLAAASEDRNP
jgi:hypothetical protein